MLNRWLADDAQIVNLSLHKQMFWMVQMVRCTDVKGVEYLDAKLDGSAHQMLVVAGHMVFTCLHSFSMVSMVHVQASARFPTPDLK